MTQQSGRRPGVGLALVAAVLAWGPAHAQEPPALAEVQSAAKATQATCVREGEHPQVCACGVGIAYARLDPKVFVVLPALQPLLKEKDTLKLVAGVVAVANTHNLSVPEAQKAYEVIRANRQEVKDICHPLRPAQKPAAAGVKSTGSP